MFAGIAPSDRKLLWIGGGVLVFMLTASVALAPPGEQAISSVPSTYSAQSGGAAAAYALLAQMHYPVKRWENPPTELNGEAENVLLILAEPNQPPGDKERKALADFVNEGGHVLFTGADIRNYFPDADISAVPPDPVWKTFRPSIPSPLAHGARSATLQPAAYWGTLSPYQLALYGEGDATAVVSWSYGEGEILWWAGSTPLTNAGITKGDNLSFFLNAVRNWDPSAHYRIYWDEYFHGQRSSLWSYVAKTSLAWGLLQFGLLALALVFTFSRRSGPIYVPKEVSRLWPLEFVDTLGGLYERAGAASSAVAVSYKRFRALLSRQLGLPSTAPDEELARGAEQRLGWKDTGVGELLQRASAATFAAKLPPSEALDIVQELESQAARLVVRAPNRKEKS
ncbi:MAG TPA: DUF4350 domain-containing protein [Candidatus Acidoferrum sp.]|nr:DUF4350 domain-containing protein [Candidatus Acidoferrum sp.]